MSEEKKIMFGSGWNLWTKILKRWIWICKKEILTKIDNTQPDLSSVAKQGDDPNASMSSVQHKIDNMTDFVTLEEINEMCDGILIPYNN